MPGRSPTSSSTAPSNTTGNGAEKTWGLGKRGIPGLDEGESGNNDNDQATTAGRWSASATPRTVSQPFPVPLLQHRWPGEQHSYPPRGWGKLRLTGPRMELVSAEPSPVLSPCPHPQAQQGTRMLARAP